MNKTRPLASAQFKLFTWMRVTRFPNMIGRCHVFGTDVRSQERIDAEQCQNCQSPISFLFTVTKPGRGLSLAALKSTCWRWREGEEMNVRWCSWRDSPVLQQWQFLSQLGDIFTLKIEQTAAPKDFSQRKNICFDLSLTGRAGSWVKHYNTSWHIMQSPHPLPHVAPFTHRTQLSKPAVTYVTVPLEKNKTKLIQSFFKLSYGLCVSWDKPIGFRMNSAWCIKLHMYLHVCVEPSYSN